MQTQGVFCISCPLFRRLILRLHFPPCLQYHILSPLLQQCLSLNLVLAPAALLLLLFRASRTYICARSLCRSHSHLRAKSIPRNQILICRRLLRCCSSACRRRRRRRIRCRRLRRRRQGLCLEVRRRLYSTLAHHPTTSLTTQSNQHVHSAAVPLSAPSPSSPAHSPHSAEGRTRSRAARAAETSRRPALSGLRARDGHCCCWTMRCLWRRQV